SHDSTMRDIRNRRMMPERFAPIHVRQMHLDHWNTHGLDGVANRNAGVRVCARIDQEYVALAARLLNSIDDPAFAVRLKRLNPHFKLASQVLEFLVDIGQAGSAVDFRFAFAEEIQVGSMDHQHGHQPAGAARCCRASRLPGFGHHLPRSLLAFIEPHPQHDCKRGRRMLSTGQSSPESSWPALSASWYTSRRGKPVSRATTALACLSPRPASRSTSSASRTSIVTSTVSAAPPVLDISGAPATMIVISPSAGVVRNRRSSSPSVPRIVLS